LLLSFWLALASLGRGATADVTSQTDAGPNVQRVS
jgi:hypothetical protein